MKSAVNKVGTRHGLYDDLDRSFMLASALAFSNLKDKGYGDQTFLENVNIMITRSPNFFHAANKEYGKMDG